MPECCNSAAGGTAERACAGCPASGAKGFPVGIGTVKALLTETALRRLEGGSYRFCADDGCPVVYFDDRSHTFTTSDVRVPVWEKVDFGERMVCYCFGENESDICAEVVREGRSHAVERVTAHIQAGRCACEVRNPRGTCCLGDVGAAVKRVIARVASAAEGSVGIV